MAIINSQIFGDQLAVEERSGHVDCNVYIYINTYYYLTEAHEQIFR